MRINIVIIIIIIVLMVNCDISARPRRPYGVVGDLTVLLRRTHCSLIFRCLF